MANRVKFARGKSPAEIIEDLTSTHISLMLSEKKYIDRMFKGNGNCLELLKIHVKKNNARVVLETQILAH